jgi:hypothetical protein
LLSLPGLLVVVVVAIVVVSAGFNVVADGVVDPVVVFVVAPKVGEFELCLG